MPFSLQGKYAELPSQQVTRDLTTSTMGGFSVADPVAAAYTFKNSKNSACVDILTSESLIVQAAGTAAASVHKSMQ